MTMFSVVYITAPTDWVALHSWVNREMLGLTDARVVRKNEGEPYYYFPDELQIRSSLENEPMQSDVRFSVDWWREPKSFRNTPVFGQLVFSVKNLQDRDEWVSRLEEGFFAESGVGFILRPWTVVGGSADGI